jgi:hypothetical protein
MSLADDVHALRPPAGANDQPEAMADCEQSGDGLPGLDEPAQRYRVRDSAGVLRATLVREPGKLIWWEGPDGRPGLGDLRVVDLPLYGSERLGRVPLETAVIVTEGPKDCQAVWRAHMPAVATVTGAATIPSMIVLEILRDRAVILWPDNDQPGFAHMERLAEALTGIAREIRWLQVPGLSPKAGAADVPTADIARIVSSYARVMRACVGSDQSSLREKGHSPHSLQGSHRASYARAREVEARRYSRVEMAQLRVGVELRFDAPSDAALRDLRDAFEDMQGNLATPSQIGYLIRCYRIHGPGTAQLLRRLYWERGSTEALLLALEVASPAWAATEPDEVSVTASHSASEPDPLPDSAEAPSGWRCGFDLGSGHVPARRADGSVFCGTCHPGTAR